MNEADIVSLLNNQKFCQVINTESSKNLITFNMRVTAGKESEMVNLFSTLATNFTECGVKHILAKRYLLKGEALAFCYSLSIVGEKKSELVDGLMVVRETLNYSPTTKATKAQVSAEAIEAQKKSLEAAIKETFNGRNVKLIPRSPGEASNLSSANSTPIRLTKSESIGPDGSKMDVLEMPLPHVHKEINVKATKGSRGASKLGDR